MVFRITKFIILLLLCCFLSTNAQTIQEFDTSSASLQSNIPQNSESGATIQDDTVESKLITIEGIVIDSLSGQGCNKAKCIVNGLDTALTDSTGAFSLQVKQAQTYLVIVTHPDYIEFKTALSHKKSFYFITCRMQQNKVTKIDQKNTPQNIIQRSTIPWTISGVVVDSRFDLAIKSSSVLLTFDDSISQLLSKDASFRLKTYFGGKHILKVTVPGFQDITRVINLVETEKQPFVVLETAPVNEKVKRHEIVVTAKREALHSSATVSKVNITRKETQQSAAGLNDPLRILQTLPGVASQSDFSARPIVRGGDVLETRIFLNGIPLIQPYHYAGLRSTINQHAMERIEFYKSGFPAQFENAQAALIEVESRKPYTKNVDGEIELNFLQGDAYLAIPLISEELGIHATAQGSWQNFVFQRSLDYQLSQNIDPFTRQELLEIKRGVHLPDYTDFGIGAGGKINDKLSLLIDNMFCTDKAEIVEPKYEYYELDSLINSGGLDTGIIYKSFYNVLHGKLEFTPKSDMILNVTTAWQKRWWDLRIPDWEEASMFGKPKYDVALNQGNISTNLIYSSIPKHLLNMGFQFDLTHTKFNVNIPRVIHQLIVEGSTNLVDFTGPLTGDSGMVFSSENSFFNDDFAELWSSFLVRYKGKSTYVNAGTFIQDEWDINEKLKLDLGTRLEFSTADYALNVSPRLSIKYKRSDKHELIGAFGHYSQNNYDVASLALSETIKPEKVWHASIGEERQLLPWLNQKVDLWGKYYFDLTSERIEFNYQSLFDTSSNIYSIIEQLIFENEMQNIDSIMDFVQDSLLFDNQFTRVRYTNNGRGIAGGIEYFLRYDPADFWNGWISVTLSKSKRVRERGWRWHNFPYDRPLMISFVNYYRLPRNYEFAVKLRYLSGIPYTWFEETKDSSAIAIGPFNKLRYRPYYRFDFKFTKGFELFGHKGTTYIEIWNSSNVPNFLLFDSKSRALRGFDLNFPFVFPFFGFTYTF